jgi:hypothetical protein
VRNCHVKAPARKWRAVGRIEHSLVDRGRSSTLFDLRPPLATRPYHKKLPMFQSAVTKGTRAGEVANPRPVNDGAVTVRTRPCDVRLSYTPRRLLVQGAVLWEFTERTFSAEAAPGSRTSKRSATLGGPRNLRRYARRRRTRAGRDVAAILGARNETKRARMSGNLSFNFPTIHPTS